jgi:hypothetical protein
VGAPGRSTDRGCAARHDVPPQARARAWKRREGLNTRRYAQGNIQPDCSPDPPRLERPGGRNRPARAAGGAERADAIVVTAPRGPRTVPQHADRRPGSADGGLFGTNSRRSCSSTTGPSRLRAIVAIHPRSSAPRSAARVSTATPTRPRR